MRERTISERDPDSGFTEEDAANIRGEIEPYRIVREEAEIDRGPGDEEEEDDDEGLEELDFN